jgi:hypothetical protein
LFFSVAKDCEVQQGAFSESEAFVHLNGAGVVGKNVQNRKFAAAANAVGKQADRGAGVAVTKVVRMRTHGANLGVAGKPQVARRPLPPKSHLRGSQNNLPFREFACQRVRDW